MKKMWQALLQSLRMSTRTFNLQNWREWCVKILITTAVIAFPISMVISFPTLMADNQYFIVILDTGILVLLIVQFLYKKGSHQFKAIFWLILTYAITVSFFIALGPHHARSAWLILCAVMASVIFGTRAGIYATLFNAGFLLIIFFGLKPNNDIWLAEYAVTSAFKWLQYVLSVSGISIAASVPVGLMLNQLDRALRDERKLGEKLAEERKKLEVAYQEIKNKISDRMKAEVALSESEERFKVLFDSAPDPIYLLNMEGDFIDVNKASEKLMGYTRGEAIGKNVFEIGILTTGGLNTARERMDKVRIGQRTGPDEYDLIRKDGSIVYAEVITLPISLQGQKFVLGVARDITERKLAEQEKEKMEAQVRQLQKMEAIGTLAGGIAHDFNNILAAILGYTELAGLTVSKNVEVHDHLDQIRSAGIRARDLIKRILDFSRQSEWKPRPVKFKMIMSEALELLRASIPSTIQIEAELKSDSIIMADPTQIHQVIMNLCTNASQAMDKQGGVLTVELTETSIKNTPGRRTGTLKPGPYVQMTISDTGSGIPGEILTRIFDPFFTTKGSDKGTGMGLAVVHGIITGYGGMITVESEPGTGSTFTVLLPVYNLDEDSGEKVIPIIPRGKEKILFIDDELTQAQLGKTLLESLGYAVICETSGLKALELFQNDPTAFDLVITDMTMPRMTGDVLAGKILEIRPDVPVIVMTGYSEKISSELARSMGIKGLVMKPVLQEELAGIIRDILDGSDPVS